MSSIGADPAGELLARLRDFARDLQKIGPSELSLRQCAIILLCLDRSDGASVQELTEALDIGEAALRRSLTRLVTRGFLIRRPAAGKGGEARLVASAEGRRIAQGQAAAAIRPETPR